MLGLYVHIPFCSAICNYCNFNRGLFDAVLKARYVEAIISEIERAGGAPADAADIALAPEHLSLYLLEVYPNAPLKDDMARARWSQAPDDDAAAMYLAAMDRLDAAGYEQYEISNVARPGCRSRHNIKYWQDG